MADISDVGPNSFFDGVGSDSGASFDPDEYGVSETQMTTTGEAILGALTGLASDAPQAALLTDPQAWGDFCTQYATDASKMGDNLAMSFPFAKVGPTLYGKAQTFALMMGAPASGFNLGPSGTELGEATLTGGTGNVTANTDASACFAPNAANIAAGTNIAVCKGKAGMSKADVESEVDAFMATGKTVTTSTSSTSMDAISGVNMATVTLDGIPLGGSTSKLLKKLPASISVGVAGPVSGAITVTLPGTIAGGMAALNVTASLFNIATYQVANATTGPIKSTPGLSAAATIATSFLNFNSFLDGGFINALGDISTAAGQIKDLAEAATGKGGGNENADSAGDQFGAGESDSESWT